MKNDNHSDYSIRFVDKSLTYISKHADLNKPEEVRRFIDEIEDDSDNCKA